LALESKVMKHDWHDHIESDPQVLHGKPCIKGTRIPAALILGYVAAGAPRTTFCASFQISVPKT
jgi:uncharacterized protein (DUF433 family)